jgi:hypothetical protein
MRNLARQIALAILVSASVAPGVALADSIEKANRKDIATLLNAASGVNSAYSASLIGETSGRVYIEYLTAVHASSLFSRQPKRVVYWLPRSEITDEQLTQFKAYKEKSGSLDAPQRGRTGGVGSP